MSRKFLIFTLILCLGLSSLTFAQVKTRFKDVPPTHWAAEAVKYLSEIGIIAGIKPDTFGGDMYVTRYQIAVLLYKLIQQFKLAELAIPAKDIAELKTLVKELSEELTLLGSKVDDLMAVLDELSGRVADVESALEGKASLEDVKTIVDESLGDVVSRLDELEGRLSDLEGLVGDLDSRLSEVEVALTEKVSLEEVEALISEKIAEIEIPDISELEGRLSDLEGLVGDLDSRLSEIEVALTEKVSLEEVEALIEDKLVSIVERLDNVEAVVSDLDIRIGTLENGISDLMAVTDDLSSNLISLSERIDALEGSVKDLELQIADLATQIAEIEKIEVTEEQIRAVVEVKLEELIEKITREVMEELIGRVSDLEGLVGDIDRRLVDVEVALTEKASLYEVEEKISGVVERLDNVEALISDLESGLSDLLVVTDDLSSNLISLSERVDALEGLTETVDNLSAMVEDLEVRVSDVEILLTDRPTMDEVIALLEEKLAEIEIPNVEELRLLVEEHSDTLEALRADVDAILVEELPTIKDDIAGLQNQVAELADRVSLIESGLKPEVLEVIIEVDKLLATIEKIDVGTENLYTLVDDLAISLTSLGEKVSSLEESISSVQEKVAGIEKSIAKFTVSGSTSVTAKKEFGEAKNIVVDDSTTLNLTFVPVDGVKISTSISLKGITSKIDPKLNKLDVSVSEAVFGIKNVSLVYDHTASSNFAVDVNGLVGAKTAKLVASAELPFKGIKASLGVDGSFDGTYTDLIVGKVYGSVGNINFNIFGTLSTHTTLTTALFITGPLGIDVDTSIAKGIKLFGEIMYDNAIFNLLAGTSLEDILAKGLSSTLKATYKDNKLELYASASYPVTPQAKVTGEVTVSDVTATPGVTVKGTVEGTIAPFAYKTWLSADLKTNKYAGYVEVSAVMDPYSFKVVADMPDLTKIADLNTTKLTVEGSYKLAPNLKLSAFVTTHYEGTTTAAGKISADLELAPKVNVNFTVLKKALGTLTTDPLKDLSASVTTSVSF
ncbi:MAG: S-layer homology domain-containing protein [Dictyoglomus sp.]|nr:S-layer homology domain-containing protein [Dictyoglomus sp.]MDW8187722.1 S-layer homology domain-containing protein [Dictyoglomus sp.]